MKTPKLPIQLSDEVLIAGIEMLGKVLLAWITRTPPSGKV